VGFNSGFKGLNIYIDDIMFVVESHSSLGVIYADDIRLVVQSHSSLGVIILLNSKQSISGTRRTFYHSLIFKI